MTDLDRAIAAAREALAKYWDGDKMSGIGAAVDDLLAALDAARGEAIHQVEGRKNCWRDCSAESAEAARKDLRDVRVVYAAPPAALAVMQDLSERFSAMHAQGDVWITSLAAAKTVQAAMLAQQPAAAMPAEVMLDALDEACKNSEGRRVSWYGYTQEQRIDVMRRAMLAAERKGEES